MLDLFGYGACVNDPVADTLQYLVNKDVAFLPIFGVMAGIIQLRRHSGRRAFRPVSRVNVFSLYLVEIRFVLRVSLHWFKQIKQPHLGKRIAADFIGDCFASS